MNSAARRITRDDLESKLRELRGEVDDAAGSARSYAIAVGAVVGVVAIGLAFWVGSRRGRKKSTIVEIRRI
jgi:hypothetical protein